MKKLLIIFGGFAFAFLLALFVLAWWVIDAFTTEKNKNKIAPAAANRWPKKENGQAPEPMKEVAPIEESKPEASNEKAQ